MDNSVKVILCNSIIHIDIGKRRFSGDEDLYEVYLRAFSRDKAYQSLLFALRQFDIYHANRYAQRLKIKSYNLGMVRLAKSCDTLSLALQSGKGAPLFTDEMNDLTTVYTLMRECIGKAFAKADEPHTRGRARV
jgi:hypothetical protein